MRYISIASILVAIMLSIVALVEGISGEWISGGVHWIAAGIFFLGSILSSEKVEDTKPGEKK